MTGDEIKLIIDQFQESEKYKAMIAGENYYIGNNDIKKRKFFFYSLNDVKTVDEYRSNIKVPSNFLVPIIDHKTSYCFAQDVTIEDFDMSIDINEELMFVAEEAAKTSIGWLYLYIDNQKNLKSKTMESKTIIPLYDNSIEKNLVGLIRFYDLGDDEYAEYWEDNQFSVFWMDKGTYKLEKVENHIWGMIPFIPFKNNRQERTDLSNIKDLIDAYDIILSDFNNNFIDFQEVILLLKNYAENVATPEAAIEVMNWLKKYKIINVKADGGFEIIAKEVPYQARKELITLLRKLIYETAQAVDLDELKGGSLTNVVIKAYFVFFDLKCNKMLKEAKKFIKKIMEFSNIYNSLRNLPIYSIGASTITFNKSVIINESELISSLVLLDGSISKKTFLSQIPFITDVEQELKQLDEDLLNYGNNDLTGGVNDENEPVK